jgi:hypothetical protein
LSIPFDPQEEVGNCPKCGKPLKEKLGRFGRFVGCTGWPRCKYRPPSKSTPRSTSAPPNRDPRDIARKPAIENPLPKQPTTPQTPARSPEKTFGGTSSPIAEEENRIFSALDKAKEPIGSKLLSVKSGISQRRLDEILPILVRNGRLKRVETNQGIRYLRG